MLIRIPRASACRESEITDEPVYLSRRRLLQGALAMTTAAGFPALADNRSVYDDVTPAEGPAWFEHKLAGTQWKAVVPAGEPAAPFDVASGYNNFFEFGPDKDDPARYAPAMDVEPWSVTVDGEVARPGTYRLEDLVGAFPLEERVYRLRCVEAWSMVIPWLGFPLAALIRRLEPTSQARYVRFETALRPEVMPGVRSRFSLLDWPYVEGLRMDEAMHPLTLLAVGMYGRVLPAQNGAPLRLVVPWKYGFKGIKSIVRISFVREQPLNTWQAMAPHEYGFYANVNPEVSHPRWSQARERRLPSSPFRPSLKETQLFNGYAEEVAGLYAGMDLRKEY